MWLRGLLRNAGGILGRLLGPVLLLLGSVKLGLLARGHEVRLLHRMVKLLLGESLLHLSLLVKLLLGITRLSHELLVLLSIRGHRHLSISLVAGECNIVGLLSRQWLVLGWWSSDCFWGLFLSHFELLEGVHVYKKVQQRKID